jgi:hypothetical protein
MRCVTSKLIGLIRHIVGRGKSSMSDVQGGLWPKGTWSTLSKPAEPRPQHSPSSSPSSNKIELNIGLPPYQNSRFPAAVSVKMPENMKVGDLNRQLADELKVNAKRWKLLIIRHMKGAQVLDEKDEMKSFQDNKKGQLYFAPAIRVR